MRYLLVLMLASFLAACGSSTKTCEGSYVLANADDVDEVLSCREITGDLDAGDSFGLSKLELPDLASIGGRLYVNVPDRLVSFSLPALTSIGGGAGVSNNTALPALTGLSKLKTVGGAFVLDHNQNFADLNALQNLESVGADLWILSNVALADVSALSGIHVGGDVKIQRNSALPTCAANALVAQLTDFSGTVTISDNDDAATCP